MAKHSHRKNTSWTSWFLIPKSRSVLQVQSLHKNLFNRRKKLRRSKKKMSKATRTIVFKMQLGKRFLKRTRSSRSKSQVRWLSLSSILRSLSFSIPNRKREEENYSAWKTLKFLLMEKAQKMKTAGNSLWEVQKSFNATWPEMWHLTPCSIKLRDFGET